MALRALDSFCRAKNQFFKSPTTFLTHVFIQRHALSPLLTIEASHAIQKTVSLRGSVSKVWLKRVHRFKKVVVHQPAYEVPHRDMNLLDQGGVVVFNQEQEITELPHGTPVLS